MNAGLEDSKTLYGNKGNFKESLGMKKRQEIIFKFPISNARAYAPYCCPPSEQCAAPTEFHNCS
jgi:hypothetical protein